MPGVLSVLPSLGCSGLPAVVDRAKKLCLTAAGGLWGGKGGLAFLLRCLGVLAFEAELPVCHVQLLRSFFTCQQFKPRHTDSYIEQYGHEHGWHSSSTSGCFAIVGCWAAC